MAEKSLYERESERRHAMTPMENITEVWDEGLKEVMGSDSFKATQEMKDHIYEKRNDPKLRYNSTSFPSWLDYADPKELMKVGYNAAVKDLGKGEPVQEEKGPLYYVYKAVLGREPDEGGYNFWNDHYQAGRLTMSQVIAEIETSPEAKGE